MSNIKYLFLLVFILSNFAFAGNKDQVIDDFSKLSQSEKRSALAVMIDGVEHDMYGFGVTKTMDDLKKYGGLPGYKISHYANYDSGGLVIPVMRVYNHKNELAETLIAGGLQGEKTFHHIGGFSKPFDFAKVRIKGDIADRIEPAVRNDVMKKSAEQITANQKFYTPEFIKSLKDKDFIDVENEQDAAYGKGYDTNCLATAIREAEEETGMILNPKEMVLLSILDEVREHQTKRDYTIKANVRGVCYFMTEMGTIKLDKSGKVVSVELNKKAILNADKIMLNFDIKKMNLKGFDDINGGIAFVSKSSIKQVVDEKDNKGYFYKGEIWNDKKELDFYMPFGHAISLIPVKTNYKTCQNIEFITAGSFIPAKNSINAWEEITKVKIKTIC